ncbi:methylthioribose-1-phosphate isomerase [Glaciihabitans tibetensis]|uniref:Methylthioribose-1-phosphate isomerase n=1 Tax=Glaciihabitans tibetensis TaxID=1266600 RepID=A0A2T0VAN2_9MICO|nr:methylthioribose-1-phosphate isomerase [Glaciihabitans tibetensis]PRY67128.1 methylthioribose-1-phosphate isomerase [Glaciihabitans tibetensis]
MAVSPAPARRTPARSSLEDSVRIESGAVWILDRRVFPNTTAWVRADTAHDVARAIRAMVTQSSGPTFAACAGMELAAVQAAALPLAEARAFVRLAGEAISQARPTNIHPREAVEWVLEAVGPAASTPDLIELAVDAARAFALRYTARSRALGQFAAAKLGDGDRILTHCWMDTYLVELVRAAAEAGKRFEWVATETRPYLQGARLTAHTLRELDQKVTLITDGMGAAALAPGSTLGRIDALVTAADRVSLDGSVVNKVGTLGLAIAASAFDVPYYALVQSPDPAASTGEDITIENRDPAEVLSTLGSRTASTLVTDAWYPAFDLTPPRFVTAVVTDRGAFAPADLAGYFSAPDFSASHPVHTPRKESAAP